METLRLGHGSCRDFAMLMIEAARSLGLAARFASGYLAVPLDDPEEPTSGPARGSTHAWAQIYLPGIGWIDFDPTSGSVGNIGLVTVAVVRNPHHATPLLPVFLAAGSAIPELPARPLALLLCYAIGLMGVLTPYATGPAPSSSAAATSRAACSGRWAPPSGPSSCWSSCCWTFPG